MPRAEPAVRAERVPRTRAETVRRLLDTAGAVFLERGMANTRVEDITSRAGYTRGAFYSAFGSMDGLVAALWERHTDLVVARVASGLDVVAGLSRGAPTVADVVTVVLDLLPVDPEWHAVSSGFLGLARRDPGARATLVAQQEVFREQLQPLLVAAVAATGRRLLVAPELLTRVVVAAHEGAVGQALVDDPHDVVRRAAVDAVILGLTAPAALPSPQVDQRIP